MSDASPTSLGQIMACRLFGAKPLSEPKLNYCQTESQEQLSVKSYLKFKKMHFKISSEKFRPFCLGRDISCVKHKHWPIVSRYNSTITTNKILTYQLWQVLLNVQVKNYMKHNIFQLDRTVSLSAEPGLWFRTPTAGESSPVGHTWICS